MKHAELRDCEVQNNVKISCGVNSGHFNSILVREAGKATSPVHSLQLVKAASHQHTHLFFFCFILALKAFCNPSLAPFSYREQQRLASDEKNASIFQQDTLIKSVPQTMLTLVAGWHFN